MKKMGYSNFLELQNARAERTIYQETINNLQLVNQTRVHAVPNLLRCVEVLQASIQKRIEHERQTPNQFPYKNERAYNDVLKANQLQMRNMQDRVTQYQNAVEQYRLYDSQGMSKTPQGIEAWQRVEYTRTQLPRAVSAAIFQTSNALGNTPWQNVPANSPQCIMQITSRIEVGSDYQYYLLNNLCESAKKTYELAINPAQTFRTKQHKANENLMPNSQFVRETTVVPPTPGLVYSKLPSMSQSSANQLPVDQPVPLAAQVQPVPQTSMQAAPLRPAERSLPPSVISLYTAGNDRVFDNRNTPSPSPSASASNQLSSASRKAYYLRNSATGHDGLPRDSMTKVASGTPRSSDSTDKHDKTPGTPTLPRRTPK